MAWAVDPAAVMAAGAGVATARAGAAAIQCVRLFFPSGFTLFPIWGQQAVLTWLTAVIQFIESPLFVQPNRQVCVLAHKKASAESEPFARVDAHGHRTGRTLGMKRGRVVSRTYIAAPQSLSSLQIKLTVY